MTTGVWILAILLILVLALYRLPAEKRVAILRVFGSSVRPLARAFQRAESASAHHAEQGGTLIERNQDLIAKRVSLIAPSGDAK